MPFGAVLGGVDLGIGGALTSGLGALGLSDAAAGIGAGILTGVGEGAATGAGLSALTGGNVGEGALTGGLTGGVLGSGVGSAIGDITGLGSTAGNLVAGAGAGALGSELTGGNVGIGALTGAGGGLLTSVLGAGGSAATPSTSSPSAAGGGSAAAVGAPEAIASAAPDQVPSLVEGGALSGPTNVSAGPISGAPTASNLAADVAASSGGGGPSGGGGFLSNLFGGGGGGITATDSAGNPVAADSPAATDFSGGGGGSSGIGGFIKDHLGLIGGAGLLGFEALNSNKQLPSQTELQSLAGQNKAAAAALESYETTGKLPPGLQSTVDAATKANEAAIRSTFARMGLSGSTPEQQALEGARTQAAASVANIATQLFNQGVSLSTLSSQELATLLETEQKQSADFSKALSTFAAGLAGAKLAA